MFPAIATQMPANPREVARQLYSVFPDFLDNLIAVETDNRGIRHSIRTVVRACSIPPVTIETVSLRDLCSRTQTCPRCLDPAVEQDGIIGTMVASDTNDLRYLLSETTLTQAERALLLVSIIWAGPNTSISKKDFRLLRTNFLIPELYKLNDQMWANKDDSAGTLVAFSARDIRYGRLVDPDMYYMAKMMVAANFIYASPKDSLWLALVPKWPIYKNTAQQIGVVLDQSITKSDIPQEVCDIFGCLCDNTKKCVGCIPSIDTLWLASNMLSCQ